MKIEKPSGTILFIDGKTEDMLKFMEELYSKISKEKVNIYQLREPEFYLEPLTLEGIVRTHMSVEETWGAISLIFTRLRGALLSETKGERIYSISSRKGICNVRVNVAPNNSGSILRFVVEGYGEAIVHVYNKLIRELSYLGEVERYE